MARYLTMLKKDIREFVTNSQYWTLAELQTNCRKREIKVDLMAREVDVNTKMRDRRPVQP